MRTIAIAALAFVAAPSLALAARPIGPIAAPPLAGVAVDPELEGKIQVAITQERLEAGASLAEHRQPYVRHLFVASGKLKVSNLVTGEEQLVGAGELATEAAGDWHLATAVGEEPVEIFVIDQLPATDAAANVGGL
jgi:quercetin dioxygenase-like cupin family protein